VISSKDFKDSDKLVTIFSYDLGLIHARVRGVKKDKAKLAFAVQPFAFIEFMLSARNGFYTVINATSIDQFFDITVDFDNYIFMLACLEVVQKTVKENNSEQELFLLLLSALNAVCYKKISAMYVFIKFMLESLKILGFGLELEKCAICGNDLNPNIVAFSFESNGLLCPKCSNKNEFLELSTGEHAILKNINESSIDNLANLKFLSRNDLISIISLLCKDFRLCTDEEIVSIKKFL
jgi:DNA repair protein RecO (recombination protein O)